MQWPPALVTHQQALLDRLQPSLPALFPRDMEGIVTSFAVQPYGEVTAGQRHFVLTHREPIEVSGQKTYRRVVLHFQGFIRRVNLKPYGNWQTNS